MKNKIIIFLSVAAVITTLPVYSNAAPASVATEEFISIAHPIDARLFGILDTTLSVQTHMASDGSFSVDYPWYAFLFSTDRAQLETKLQAVGKAVETWGTTSLSVQQQGTLSEMLQAALESTTTAALP